MFDLNQAIAEWRGQLFVNGITSSRALDELEGHLRDDIEHRVIGGAEVQEAFIAAWEQLGDGSLLGSEFKKTDHWITVTQNRVQRTFLTLAGIPPQYVIAMNTSPHTSEPRWATYLKSGLFVAPALFMWSLACVFVVPKLQTICAHAGLPDSSSFWKFTESNIRTTLFFGEYWMLMALTLIALICFLELRSAAWPRYRRATLGVGAFVLNSAVLISIFLMVIAALVAAPALMHQGR